ncbi:hypothetical protein N752_15355 [Desulforamulus aquiferis]|nr:MtnX-like HAD-IB family phosphatase [Desulforamulus aquiferis]RYD04219.1 hypothetical protein N752_15355 [Desulforamulus aquiferis]
MEYIFFVDFDGTITVKDTCDMLIEGNNNPKLQHINELWERKQISTPECSRLLFKEMNLARDAIKVLIRDVEVDPFFATFLGLCKANDFSVAVVSDGYDMIIKGVLEKEKLEVPFYSNSLNYIDEFLAEFPYFNNSCGRCGTCKTELLEGLSHPGIKRVYIGDGMSDFCPASHCELVFAKGKLKDYCINNDISFKPYDSFRDIIVWLQREGCR